MTFKELCELRYSTRAYQNRPVDPQALEYIKECVRLAPSAVNRQPWKFVIIDQPDGLNKLQQCYNREWLQQAPLCVLALKNTQEAWTRRYDDKNHADIDVAIAVEHLCLAAAELGLGSCWVCNFRIELCRELFAIPAEWEPVAIVPLGYPADERPEKTRKATADIWTDSL